MVTFENLVSIAEAIASRRSNGQIKLGTDEVKTHCISPNHNDDNPSMSLFITEKGQWGVKCYSCDADSFALRMDLIEQFPELDNSKPKDPDDGHTVQADSEYSSIPEETANLPLLRGIGKVGTPVAWIPICDCSDEVFNHHYEILDQLCYRQGKIITPYYYTDEAGHTVGIRLRLSDPVRKGSNNKPEKLFQPLNTFVVDNNGKQCVRYLTKEMPTRLPPYRLHEWSEEKPILIVEGEKTADKAARLFPGFFVTTWGTGQRLDKTDWRRAVKKGQVVYCWPDNDAPGKGYMRGTHRHAGLVSLLLALGAEVYVVDLNVYSEASRFPEGWDLADPLPEGIPLKFLGQCLESAASANTWSDNDASTFCLLMQYDPSIDPNDPCKEHWDDPRLDTDPYGIDVPPNRVVLRGSPREYRIDGLMPIGRAVCNLCPYAGLDTSPKHISQLEPVHRKAVFIENFDKVYDLMSGNTLQRTAINASLRWYYGKENIFNRLVDRQASCVSQVENIIGMRRIIETEFSQKTLNLWRPGFDFPKIIKKKAPPNLWLEIARLAVPDEKARNFLLDWIAYQIQCPGAPVNYLPILSGGQGTGKDSLLKPLQAILGRNMRQVTRSMLNESFNDYLLAQVVVLQELDAADWMIYNKLKTQITGDVVSINSKNMPRYDVEHRPNMIGLSNSFHPVPIEKDDRRIWIYRSPLTLRDMRHLKLTHHFKAFYDPESGYLSQLEEFLWWALSRDLSDFDADTVHRTSHKIELMQSSLPALGQVLFDMVSENRITQPILYASDIKLRARHYAIDGRSLTPRKFNFLLRTSGFEALGKVRHPSGRITMLYAFTDYQIDELGLEVDEEMAQAVRKVEKLRKLHPDHHTLQQMEEIYGAYIQPMDDDDE